jgi:hypothetical protein
MHSKTDIFFIILLIVVISIIIGLNISKKKEQFTVSDAQEGYKYKEIKEEILEEPDSFINLPDKVSDENNNAVIQNNDQIVITNTTNTDTNTNINTNTNTDINKPKFEEKKPDLTIMVTDDPPLEKYRKARLEKAYITAGDFGWDGPPLAVSCANSSIAEQYKSGNKKLLPNQVGCGHPNKLTAENYYKTHYKMQIVPIEDYVVRGANYLEYADYPTPYQTRNMRILSQNTKGLPVEQTKFKNIPIAYNYAFHNTPAMPMP